MKDARYTRLTMMLRIRRRRLKCLIKIWCRRERGSVDKRKYLHFVLRKINNATISHSIFHACRPDVDSVIMWMCVWRVQRTNWTDTALLCTSMNSRDALKRCRFGESVLCISNGWNEQYRSSANSIAAQVILSASRLKTSEELKWKYVIFVCCCLLRTWVCVCECFAEI